MRWLSLELIKLNSRIDTDYEDELLTIYGNSAEQQVLKAKSAKLTKDMKAIKDAFPLTHPNIEPDEVTYTVVCVD